MIRIGKQKGVVLKLRILSTGAAAILVYFLLSGCSGKKEVSPVLVLEELETAARVADPVKREERLKIFIANHPDHPFKIEAYRKLYKTILDSGDTLEANRVLQKAIERERIPWERGELIYEKFAAIMESDTLKALAFVDSLLSVESFPRLLFYIGYDISYAPGGEELAERCYKKAAKLTTNRLEKAQILSFYGSMLKRSGRKSEAESVLTMATAYPTGARVLADMLWKDGRRKKALDVYIDYAAVMPGARKYVKLDSLYSFVYKDSLELGEMLIASRIFDGGMLPDHTFFDLEGRRVNLAAYRGTKLLIYIWSPT